MRAAVTGLALVLGLGSVIALAQSSDSRPSGSVQGDSRSSQPATLPNAPLVLRQTTFNIPFTVHPAGSIPAEIQLFVSTDRGTRWRLIDRVSPSAGRFPFRAAGDGEYWFAIRTIEANGTTVPRTPSLQPSLRVVIDTNEPRVDFDVQVATDGKVNAAWRIVDPNLASESLKLEYQVGVNGPWQPIAVEKQPNGSTTLVGRTTWLPQSDSRVIHVRAEVADRAANKAAVTRRLFLPKAAPNAQDGARLASSGPPRAAPPAAPADAAAIPWPADAQARPPARPSAADSASKVPFSAQEPAADSPSGPATTPVSANSASAADGAASPREIVNPFYTSASPLGETHQYPAVPGGFQPPVGKSAGPDETAGPPASTNAALPPGERPRMIGAARFSLEYDVESVGPAGVAEIQLWGTADQGRTWKLWQTDNDKQSPVDVEVPGEGIYGFRVVIIGNSGLAGRAPREGDLADLWVGVDRTNPAVRLTSAIYGEGRFAGQLDIRWEASDASFADRPVSLLFSEKSEGPWSTIASGLPNTGQYYWSVDSRIPERIYLRIEAMDGAGNRGEHQLAEPISTTGLAPQARIRGLRPLPGVSATASEP